MLIQIKKLLILDTYRLKNLILISIFLSIIYFCQLFLRQKISLNLFLLLTVLFIINYFCYFLYLSLEKEKKYFPLYPLIIFYYLITYSAYFYFDQDEYFFIQGEVLDRVIIAISLGLLFFSLGYFFPNIFYKDKKHIIFKDIDKYNGIVIIGSYIFLIFIQINNYSSYINYGFLNQLREPLTLLIVAILQLKYFEKKKFTYLSLNIFFIVTLFFLELSAGSTVFPFLIILMLIAINYLKTKKLNLISISFIFYCIFFFHEIKHEIRFLNHIHDNSVFVSEEIKKGNLETLKKSGILNYLVKEELFNDILKDKNLWSKIKDKSINEIINNENLHFFIKDEILNEIISNKLKINELSKDKTIFTSLYGTYGVVKDSLNLKQKIISKDNSSFPKQIFKQDLNYRIFHSNITLQRAIEFTPHAVKFLNGKTYESIIYKPIPRFIYNNKPREEWGNTFGKLYKILNIDDFVTSWNFPVLSEFYSNFGFKGVIFGMLLLGLITKVLIFFIYQYNKSILLTSMSYVVIFNLVYQESNLTITIGKMINQSTFFLCLIFAILILNIFIRKFKNES